MATATVMTVQGPVSPAALGVVMPHEHIVCDIHSGNPDNILNNSAISRKELVRFRQAGGDTIIDVSTRDIGRDPLALTKLSEAAGIHIITCTGYYTESTARAFIETKSVEQLAEEMIRDITHGIDGTGIKAGIIGELASANHVIQPGEERVLRAAARAHLETGAAISLHSAIGRPAIDQLAILRSEGMSLERVIAGHTHYQWHRHRDSDLDYYHYLLDQGCYLEFDQIGWGNDIFPEAEMAQRLAILIEKGYVRRLLISSDLCRCSFFHVNGGFGYDYILTRFVPMLRSAGISDNHIQTILKDNPAEAIAF